MLQSQLKSLLAEGVEEFGITPTLITDRLPHWVPSTVKSIKSDCPTGLTRAKVIEDGHHWIEKYTFGCGGDQVHEQKRYNGVLVEFDLKPANANKLDGKYKAALQKLNGDEEARSRLLLDIAAKHWQKHGGDLVQIVDATGGQKKVRAVISRKAVVVPWNEYAMVLAEREKISQEQDERAAANDKLADALRIPSYDRQVHPDEMRWSRWGMRFEAFWTGMRGRPDAEVYDHDENLRAHADHIGVNRYWGENKPGVFFVSYEMPAFHAKKIAAGLDLLRRAHESGQLANTIVGEEVEKFLADFDKPQQQPQPEQPEETGSWVSDEEA